MAAPEDEEEAEEAAPAEADKGLPPMAAPEAEEATPAEADKGLPPMAARENEEEAKEAAPVVAGEGLPPVAAGADKAAPEETTAVEEDLPPTIGPKKHRPAFGFWTAMAMLAVTGLRCPDVADGLMAHNGANTTNRVDIFSPMEPAAHLMTTPQQPRMQAADVADRVGIEMECRAVHDDEEKGGGYPIAALEKLVEGRYPPFNPDFLAKDTDSHK